MSINVVNFSSARGAGNVAKTLVDGFSKIGLDARLITATSSNLRANTLDNPSLTLSAAKDAYLRKAQSWNSLISLSRDKHSVLYDKLPASELTIFRWMNGLLGQESESRKILNRLQSRFFESQEEVASITKQLNVLILAADLDDPTKGVWDVADSLNRFLGNPNVELTMVGRYSNKLASFIRTANFTGSLDSGSVMRHMREHDVLLVPSLFETAGMVIAEAGSQGTPTIAREVGGMPEMTNYGESGYLFDTNEKLDEILDSLSTKDLSSKGLSAREWAQQLKPELIAAQYAEEFLR